jgi:hypothetical protein
MNIQRLDIHTTAAIFGINDSKTFPSQPVAGAMSHRDIDVLIVMILTSLLRGLIK